LKSLADSQVDVDDWDLSLVCGGSEEAENRGDSFNPDLQTNESAQISHGSEEIFIKAFR